MIRREDHDRVLVGAARLQRVEHLRDLLVDRCLQLVVELQVRLGPRLRRQDRPPQVDHALLAGRLGREVFLVRRRLLDVRDGRGVVAQPLCQRDDAEHRVVVRVQERADRKPWLIALFAVQALQQLDRLVRGEDVLDRAGVVLAEPVRLRPHPFRKAVGVEEISLEISLDVLLLRLAVVVDREEVAVAVIGVEVRVRGVPLALEIRPIAAGAEPVAHRRHAVRRQPEHVVAVGALGQPVCLRHAVQRGMVSGQQRRATRRARGGDRIVVPERDAVRSQALLTRAVFPAVRRELIRLIGWWIPELVGHHEQDVRAAILAWLAHGFPSCGDVALLEGAPLFEVGTDGRRHKPSRTRCHQPQRMI